MALTDLKSPEELKTFVTTSPNAVVCFSATWCGPCKASKPTLISTAESYERDPLVDLKFGIVYENVLGQIIQEYRVTAFPTYVLFVKGSEAGRIQGVNFDGLKKLIEENGCKNTMGEGHGLGGGVEGKNVSMAEAKRLRLERFEKATKATMPHAAPPQATEEKKAAKEEKKAAKEDTDVTMEDADVTMEDAEAPATEAAAAPVDPTVNLSKEALETLTSVMGFSLLRAQKGLLYSDGTVEQAVEWLLAHQDDDDIDAPIPPTPVVGVVQSYKCVATGKIFKSMADLELHANRTGHSDFEECTDAVIPLTPEEKAAKVEQIKLLLKKKRAEREEVEKQENVIREKARRTMGQEMGKTREVMEVEKRKRDAKSKKREKDQFKRERDRIRKELAKDKAERQANKGKLGSRIGVDGYNPDGIQYDIGNDDDDATEEQAAATTPAKKKGVSANRIDEYISKVCQYRAGGDGGKCLKILLAYVKNVADSDEEKFKTINTENKAFKTKVKPFIGGKQLLLAVGFEPSEKGGSLVLVDGNKDVLKATKSKLEAALKKYNAS